MFGPAGSEARLIDLKSSSQGLALGGAWRKYSRRETGVGLSELLRQVAGL